MLSVWVVILLLILIHLLYESVVVVVRLHIPLLHRSQASTDPMWQPMSLAPFTAPFPASTVIRVSRNNTISQGIFAIKNSLVIFEFRHLKSHLGIKSHSCSECGESFVDGTRLKQHRWIHLQHRAYRYFPFWFKFSAYALWLDI